VVSRGPYSFFVQLALSIKGVLRAGRKCGCPNDAKKRRMKARITRNFGNLASEDIDTLAVWGNPEG
jgi:hypothetical protein